MRLNLRAPGAAKAAAGFTLIEVLVTVVILVIGALGVVGLQARAMSVEFESYQRGEALNLARELRSRLLDSRGIVAGYLDASVSSTDGSIHVGTGSGATNFTDGAGACVDGAGVALASAKYEMCQWAQALLGASVKQGTANVGAMANARGCLIRINPPENNALADFYVVVVWQGMEPGSEPPADSPAGANLCGRDTNFGTGLLRGISLRVLVPDLKKAT